MACLRCILTQAPVSLAVTPIPTFPEAEHVIRIDPRRAQGGRNGHLARAGAVRRYRDRWNGETPGAFCPLLDRSRSLRPVAVSQSFTVLLRKVVVARSRPSELKTSRVAPKKLL